MEEMPAPPGGTILLDAVSAAGRCTRFPHTLARAMTPAEIRILRAMTPAQKLAAAEDMYRAARAIKAAALRRQHPDWSEEEIRRKVRDIFLHGRT